METGEMTQEPFTVPGSLDDKEHENPCAKNGNPFFIMPQLFGFTRKNLTHQKTRKSVFSPYGASSIPSKTAENRPSIQAQKLLSLWCHSERSEESAGDETRRGTMKKIVLVAIAMCGMIGVATQGLATNPKFIVGGYDVIKLIQDLGSPTPGVRYHAVRVLNSLGYAANTARGPLQDVLATDPLAYIRGSAAEALSNLRDPKAVPAVAASLTDPDSYVVRSAIRALGRLGGEKAVTPLGEVIVNSTGRYDGVHRFGACASLAEIRLKEALPYLIQGLSDGDWRVRASCAGALGWIKDPAALPALQPLVNDPNGIVSLAAQAAIAWITSDPPAQLPPLDNASILKFLKANGLYIFPQ